MGDRGGSADTRAPGAESVSWLTDQVATIVTYALCLGMLDHKERAELLVESSRARVQATLSGDTSLMGQIMPVWLVSEPAVRSRNPKRWDLREALRALGDVPVHAVVVAFFAGAAPFLILSVLGLPRTAIGLGLATALFALVGRALYVVHRDIRRFLEPAYQDWIGSEGAALVTFANLLTIARVPIAALIPIWMADDRPFAATMVLLVVVGLDSIDGYVARHISRPTKIGILLDPFVGRLVLSAAVSGLIVHTGHVPYYVVVVACVAGIRDLMVATLGVGYFLTDMSPKPNRAGSAAATLAFSGIGMAYVSLAFADQVEGSMRTRVHVLAALVVAAGAVAGAVSIWNYKTSIETKMYWRRDEAFDEAFPARALLHAYELLVPPAMFATHRRLLDELVAANHHFNGPPHKLVAVEVKRADGALRSARKSKLMQQAGMLEERLRNLRTLHERLSGSQRQGL